MRLSALWLCASAWVAACGTASGGSLSTTELRHAVSGGDMQAASALASRIARFGDVAGQFSEIPELLASARDSDARVLVAVALESLGNLSAALDHWSQLAAAAESPQHRILAARRVLALVDSAPLSPQVLTRLSAASKGPGRSGLAAAEALEQVAIRLGDNEHAVAARDRQGAISQYTMAPTLLSSLPAIGLLEGRSLVESGRGERSMPRNVKRVKTPDGTVALPATGPGVFAVWVDVPASQVELEIALWGAPSVRIFDDSRQIGINDRISHYAPHRMSFAVPPGPKRSLELHVATQEVAADVRLFIRPRRIETHATNRGLAADLGAWSEYFSTGAYQLWRSKAETALEKLPLVAIPWVAQAIIEDPSIPRNVGQQRARRLLRAALRRAPGFSAARAMLARLAIDGGDVTTAEALLRQGDVGQWRVSIQAAIAEDRQQVTRLLALLDAERSRLPSSCTASQRWLDARMQSLRLQPAALEHGLPGCFSVQLRRATLLRQAWRHDSADRVLRTLATRARPGSERASVAISKARLAVARSLPAAAYSMAVAGLREGRQLESLLKLARTAAELQRAPEKVEQIQNAMRRQAHLGQGRRSVLRPAEDLGLPLTDGHALALTTLKWQGAERAREPTILLDEHHLSIVAGAVMVHRVHRIIYLNDDDAVSSLGEIPIPDEAEVLVARTWKPTGDGRLQPIEPEDMGADKGAISLPALAAGAVVEVAWFWLETPTERGVLAHRLAPGWVTPRFGFASEHARVDLARLILRTPTGTRLSVHRDGNAPEHVSIAPNVRLWQARHQPRLIPEPLDPRPDRRSPGVRVSSGVTLKDVQRTLQDMLRGHLRDSHEVRAFLRRRGLTKATISRRSPTERLEALFQAVAEHVKPDGRGSLHTSASFTAAAEAGSRVILLAAACRELEISCDVVLARPRHRGKRLPQSVVALEDYVYPLVMAKIGSQTIWLDPSSPFIPFDYVPPIVQRVHAMVVGVSKGLFVTTPSFGPSRDGMHALRLSVKVQSSGEVVMEASETIEGFHAASWRNALSDLPQRARHRALARLIQGVAPSTQVTQVQILNLEHRRKPLNIRWTARGVLTPTTKNRRALRLGLHPQNLVRRTVRGPTRRSPLLIGRPIRSNVRIDVTLPDGATFLGVPPRVDMVQRLANYVRESRLVPDEKRLEIRRDLDVFVGTIEPRGYPDWVRVARSLDQADAVYLEVAFP